MNRKNNIFEKKLHTEYRQINIYNMKRVLINWQNDNPREMWAKGKIKQIIEKLIQGRFKLLIGRQK